MALWHITLVIKSKLVLGRTETPRLSHLPTEAAPLSHLPTEAAYKGTGPTIRNLKYCMEYTMEARVPRLLLE